MPPRFLRPLLIFEFLIAIEVWLTFWSQVGGQYHLDLMFWPWKFGLTVAAAWLICAITGNLYQHDGTVSRRAVAYAALLFAVMVTAGVVTYYYHMNEPTDEDNSDAPASQVTRLGKPLPAPSADPPCNRTPSGIPAC
jgi:hypothetical protein